MIAQALAPDASYRELRRIIVSSGLLERAYGYYAWRSGVSFALLGAGVALAFAEPALAGAVSASVLVMAFGSVQVALVGHDAGHLAVFKRRSSNYALGSACYSLCLGISFRYWMDRHTRHHVQTNDEAADPDVRWTMGRGFFPLLPFAFRLEGWQFAVRELRGSQRLTELAVISFSTLVWLIPTMMLGWSWDVALVCSQILAGLYLSAVIAPNHIGMPTLPAGARPPFLERQLQSSRNVAPNTVWDFVFGGLNYQIEHHLFPTMPRSHFGAARSLVKPFCAAHGLAYTELGAGAAYQQVLCELQRVSQAPTGASA